MLFPMVQLEKNLKASIDGFGGINCHNGGNGEFSYMKNMTSDNYPYASPSVLKEEVDINPEIKNISACIAPGEDGEGLGGFTGIADGKFYYRNKVIPIAYGHKISENEKVELTDFGGQIIIAPFMYTYEYQNPERRDMVYPLAGGIYDKAVSVKTDTAENGKVSFDLYSESIRWKNFGIEEGDSIVIETSDDFYKKINVNPLMNKYDKKTGAVTAIVSVVNKSIMTACFYDMNEDPYTPTDGSGSIIRHEFDSGEIKIYKYIPKMRNICTAKNRLWATADNGEAIYASVPGKPGEFMRFEGLSTDSWYTEVENDGPFTGIASLRDSVVAFKKNHIYHIYGDRPSNFAISKQFQGYGCIDFKSICKTDTSVFFLGYDGIYEYSGNSPVNVSKKAGLDKNTAGVAFAAKGKYYISPEGSGRLLAYDTEKNFWHSEAEIEIVGGFVRHNEIYMASEKKLFKFSNIYRNEWEAVLCDMTDDTFLKKGINNVFIRIKNSENSKAFVHVSCDEEEFCCFGSAEEPGEYTFRVPVRFKKGDKYSIKLSGNGDTRIMAIERRISASGVAVRQKGGNF